MEDLNKEIEGWKEVKPETMGVYLSDKRDSINTDIYSDAVRSKYDYETQIQSFPKDEYVGMVRFNEPNLKRNIFTSAYRGAWTGLLNFPSGIDNAVTGLSEWITNAIYSGDLEAQKEIAEAANACRQKNDAWVKYWSYEKGQNDNSLAFDLGSGAASMFSAIALSVATRNPSLAASMFGVTQYGNLNKELREKDIDVNYANLTALVGGLAEGGLEKVGLDFWFKNFASKKISSFLFKQGVTEFAQESLQQSAEEFVMRFSGGRVDGKSFWDVTQEVLYAGALGGILGVVGGGVSIPSTQAYKGRAQKILERGGMSKDEASRYIEARLYGTEKEQQELQNKVNKTVNTLIKDEATLRFKKLGVDEDKAKEWSEQLLTNPEEVKASLIDTLNKEADFATLQNNSLEDDVKYFEEQRKKDIIAEAFEIEDKLKADALEAGLSEEEAEFRAKTEAAFAKRVWEETGITPLEYYENESTKIENENINESELTDEENSSLEAAEKARKQEEDIPFFQSMYRSPLKTFDEFYDDVMHGENDKPRFFTENINGVNLDIPFNAMWHDDGKHNLTKKEWQGIIKALKKNKISAAVLGDYSKMHGVSIKMIVPVGDVEYGVVIEHMKSGRNLVQSAFLLEDKGWIRPKQKKSSQAVANKPRPKSSRLGNSLNEIIANLDDIVNSKKEYNQSPLYQSGNEDRNLVAVHSISARNLEKAIDFGGFPVPSIAIINKNQDFHFNNMPITLVGNKEMIDPSRSRNEVYNRDIWSKTFPFATYGKVKKKTRDDFRDNVKEYFVKTDSENELGSLLYYIDRGVTPERAVTEFQDSDGARLMYLEKEKGEKITIPTYDAAERKIENINHRYGIEANKQFIEKMAKFDSYPSKEVMEKDILPLINEAIDNSKYEGKEKYAERFRETARSIFIEDGRIDDYNIEGLVRECKEYVREKGTKKIDTYALRDMLKEKITDVDEYNKWAEKYIQNNLVGEPLVAVGKKLLPFNLENVTKAMTQGVTKNAQESFVYGSGKVIAAGAKQLKNIKEIKLEGKKLVSQEEQAEKIAELQDDMNVFTNKFMTSSDFTSSMQQKEAAFRALGTVTAKENPTNEDMQKALNYEFDNNKKYSDELLAAGVKIAKSSRNLARYYFEAKPQRAVRLNEFSGAIIPTDTKYDNIAKKVEDAGLKVVRSDNQIEALQELDDQNKVFFQGENNPRASYMPISRTITLFKTADHSSLIHELGHHFTMRYVKLLEENGRMDKLDGFYKWLGINDISQATTETWEQMARGFETYVMEGAAPNLDTENIFQKFKRYLLDIYKGLKPEQINDDVREFFDKMLAGEEEMPDITGLEGKIERIGEVIKGALKGEEVNFEGLSMDDLKKLTKLAHMRRPRKPKTLKQKIRSAGGIDIEFAKLIGIYDEQKGNDSGFFKKNGAIDKEDTLIEFLQGEGYLTGDMDTYENMADITDKAIDLIERADSVYTTEEQQTIATREAVEQFAYDAFKKLGDIKTDDIYKAMKVLKKYDLKAVDKNTLQYLNARIKEVDRLQKQALRDLKQKASDKQAELIDFIKKLPLNAQDKLKVMDRLKRAKLVDEFEDVLNKASELAKEFYINEKRKMLSDMINDEVKSSKPKQVTKQKYDYANNKLFKDLRDYSKMTQEKASEVLSKSEISEEITPENLVRMHYLNYKANGAKTSMEMLEQVYADIVIAKQQGMQAKDDADFEKSMNREEVRQEIIDAIDNNNADKNTVKTRIGNLYRKGLTNLYSLINSITSKKLAQEFEMETVLNKAHTKFHNQTEALTKKVFKIYGANSKGELLNKFAELGQTIGKLYNVDGIKVEELSKMKLIDIYNAMKNEKTHKDYIDSYGEDQLNRVLSYLNDADRAFGDLMMEDINSLFPEVNKTYIRVYGMDLLKVLNYWPATSEHTTETSMLGDYYSQQTTPSSWKERVKGRVTPIPENAWAKYLKHINENIYMINTAEKYKELATVFKSKRIRNKITNKFGASVYNELMKQIEALSLNAKSESLNYIESAFGSIVNNFVVAKIAVAPTVFAGQLTSITNYAEDVKSVDFYKNFAKGLAHPKQTIAFMKKVAGDFLEARYKGGYNESISNVLHEAEDAMSQKYRLISPKLKYNTAQALSSFVRMGDIGAIIFGGYGQIQTNIENGMSLEDAVKKFEFDTLRSQQSSVKASLGRFQQSKGIARMFLAFKNTQHQYFRKIADAIINYQRGEISGEKAAKIIGNYALIQTSLYVMAKNLVNAGIGLLDDDDKITDGVLEQILLGTLDAIPFLSDALHFAYRRLSGQYSPNLVSMVGIDDIRRSINKFYKQDKNVYDYIEIITPLIEGVTSLPVQRFERIFKKYAEK